MKIQNLISNIPTVASGGTVSFNLPIGVRYHGLNLFLSSSGTRTAVNATNFQRLRIIIDTVTLIDWDWPSIQLYAQRRDIPLSVGQIPIFFTDPLLVGQRNAYCGSIDTKQNITNVQVYVLLGVITTPSLTGELIFDNMPNVMPQMVAGKRTNVAFNTPIMKTAQVENVPTATAYAITSINNAYPLDTVTFYNQADVNITSVRCLMNGVTIFEGVPGDLAREFWAYSIGTPIGSIVLPFTYDRYSPISAAAFTSMTIFVNSLATFAMGIAVEAQLKTLT